jgi:uncharacterized repeat protein (TIGR02543 family)
MATATGQIVGAAWSEGSWTYNMGGARYAGWSGDTYYTTFIQFKTPAFTGQSTAVQINFCSHAQGVGNTANLRWALCSSDANHGKYHGTASAVSDAYQITSGTASFANNKTNDVMRTVTVGTTALKPNTTYYLALWSSDKTGMGLRAMNYSYGTASVTVTYLNTYTVTYHANGHGTAPAAQTVTQGGSLTLPTMTAGGYRFLGWATSSGATSGMTGNYIPTGNVTLYAVWIRVYTVTYHANGHGVSPGTATVDGGGSVTLPPMEADGYRFKGWAEDPGTQEGMLGSYTPTGDVTLYAIWVAVFEIVYYANGVVEDPESVTVEAGESIQLPQLQADGYRFAGWSEDPWDSQGQTGEYWPQYSVNLYAIWIDVYTVNYDCGGICVDPPADHVVAGGFVYLPEPEAEGYRFAGWGSYPGADYGTTGEYWPDSSVTLYAVWVMTYTVTFKTNGICPEPEPVTVDAGESIMLPVVEAEGHRFGGWTTDPADREGLSGWYCPGASVILYALWESGGSYFRIMHDGDMIRCPIRILHQGQLVRCKAYINQKGQLVKL